MLTSVEQETLDIDWFFTDDEHVGFVASGGGRLPKSVVENWEGIQIVIKFLRELPTVSEFLINPNINQIVEGKVDDWYLSDFINFSKKGIYAFDKTKLNDFSDLSYHLVASPIYPLKVKSLPKNIQNILLNIKLNSKIYDSLMVNDIL